MYANEGHYKEESTLKSLNVWTFFTVTAENEIKNTNDSETDRVLTALDVT
jgi:hypothetical protein